MCPSVGCFHCGRRIEEFLDCQVIPKKIVLPVWVVGPQDSTRLVQVQCVEGVLGDGDPVGLDVLNKGLPTFWLHLQVEVDVEEAILVNLGHAYALEGVEVQTDYLISNLDSKIRLVGASRSEFGVIVGCGPDGVEPLYGGEHGH